MTQPLGPPLPTASGTPTYGSYLGLDELLAAQHPVSENSHEMLFIIIHQSSELWFKLLRHELSVIQGHLRHGDIGSALPGLCRCGTVVSHLSHSWAVLETMNTTDFLAFRHQLSSSSGMQSLQYRLIEFALGRKNRGVLALHSQDAAALTRLDEAIYEPSVYDSVIELLANRGFSIDKDHLQRDVTEPYVSHPDVLRAWQRVYSESGKHAGLWNLAEHLITLDTRLWEWRCRHVQAVTRLIGARSGTGGTSGVSYLSSLRDELFFPELWETRSRPI